MTALRALPAARLADRRGFLALLIIVVCVVMSLLSPYFLRIENVLSMTQYSAMLGLLALGQTLVILTGGGSIDLSVGSTLSLSGVVFGLLSAHAGINPWAAAVIAVLAGAALGGVNALLVTVLRIPALIATLGTLYLYSSAALVLSDGVDINGFDRAGFSQLGQTAVLGVPTQVLLVLLPAYVLAGFMMARTRLGREVYEVGSNAAAAELAGVRVRRVRATMFCLSGALAGLGAVIAASWLLTAKTTAGQDMELQAITIAVLGGTAITGGIGRVSGTFLGLLLVVVLNAGLQLAGVNNTWQIGVLGVVLVASVVINNFVKKDGP